MTPIGVGPTGDATWDVSLLGDWRGWKWMVDGDRNVWRTDGTAAGTVNIGKQTGREPLAQLGDWLYFFGVDGDLLRTQGIPGDTTRAIDLQAAGIFAPGGATTFSGRIYFSAVVGEGTKWFRTDGTSIEEVAEGGRYAALGVNGRLVTRDRDGSLWSTDGINEPVLLNANTGAGRPEEIVAYGAYAYFTGYDEEHGYELWRTDGTLAGTRLEADLEPGPASSGVYQLHPTPRALYFSAWVAPYGEEPWVLRH
jgi:ELWxxDGT repeat protein